MKYTPNIPDESGDSAAASPTTIKEAEKALDSYFGFKSFREGQRYVIERILEGRDILSVMPTGAGKSLCFQIPSLIMDGITVVISPLISLMNDQVRALVGYGIHAAFLNSSLTPSACAKVMQRAYSGEFDLIYVAPERLESLDFIEFCKHMKISMVTVDEAHCVSQWGQDFRPGYLKIAAFIDMLPVRPVVSAFTAIASEQVRTDIARLLHLQNPLIQVTGYDRPNLFFSVERFRSVKEKNKKLISCVRSHRDQMGIIYCSTRKNVDSVHEMLCKMGISAARYHAGAAAGFFGGNAGGGAAGTGAFGANPAAAAGAEEYAGDLFNELKALRTDFARREKLRPYMIFSDKALLDMTRILPENISQLKLCFGVGDRKAEKYGQAFLEVIGKYLNYRAPE